jgi:hypothetical protein
MWMITGIIISFVFCGACINSPGTITANDTVSATPVVATPTLTVPTIATATATPIPVRAITITPTSIPIPEEPEPDWTEAPIVYPTAQPDTTKITFIAFKNGDFIAEYPSSWAVVNQTFDLPDTTINDRDVYRKEGRMVTFTSEDGHVKMMVTVYDLIAPGRYSYYPTIDAARRSVQLLFPNASADHSVYNYQYKKNDQGVFTSKYDVLFKSDVEYYPYSYTEESWITYNHFFNVDFIVMTGNLEDYTELKYHMMKSIETEGLQQYVRW